MSVSACPTDALERMAELYQGLAAVHHEAICCSLSERFRILHLLLKSVVYDGATGELKPAFYPLGITSLTAKAATIGQPAEVAA